MLHLYAGIVSWMSISIFGVELAPFDLHSLILRSSMMFHLPKGGVNVRAGFRPLRLSGIPLLLSGTFTLTQSLKPFCTSLQRIVCYRAPGG